MEDFVSASSTTPMSAVPVQFIIKMVNSPTCSFLPEMVNSGQTCVTLKVNETYTSDLFAVNHCGSNVSIIDISSVSFTGMQQSTLQRMNSSLYYKTLTWTPSSSQLGYHIMCSMALNR